MKRTVLLAMSVAALLAGVVLAGVWTAARDKPAVATADRYASLVAARESRRSDEPLDRPASVLAATSEQPRRIETGPAELIAPVERIAIPSIGVGAQIVEMGLTPAGALDVPNSPDLVAWYGFTGKPGMGGNAVMSGHVDYRGHGPAVFWDLRKLKPGDQIDVSLRDGNVIEYEVTTAQIYPVEEVPMAEVVARTAQESLTLITCGGIFVDGHYTERLVVRAVRIKP